MFTPRFIFFAACWPLATYLALAASTARAAPPDLRQNVLPLLRSRCVKCHGPNRREAKLDLGGPLGLARGGESGAAIDRAAPLESLLWQRIDADEMPPDEPLSAAERAILRNWLAGGATDLPESPPESAAAGAGGSDHWAFQPLTLPQPAGVRDFGATRGEIDRFLLAQLEARGLGFSPQADRHALLRRLSFDLKGMPPTIDEIAAFVSDNSPDAYERLVERYLASPHYGERWGKLWLDAAGYADSNGYFNADSDRPLAYRYRDYVVASLNRDKPFDQFLREQLAGDELAGFQPDADLRPEQVEPLIATHFLRNGQDGTGESDGNPDEVRADRYSVLEGAEQILGSALFGLTLQCARCHDHKFEPITQREYYQLQAVLAPAFNLDRWLKPNERVVYTASAPEIAAWKERLRQIDDSIAERRREFADWYRQRRPRGTTIFEDHFDDASALAGHWSNTAPRDDRPAGDSPVALGNSTASPTASPMAPAAQVTDGRLRIIESGAPGNRWLSTTASFDWTPDRPGDWIEASFDLIADRLPGGNAAERIGYYIALGDYDDSSQRAGGNLLIDGNPAGGAALHLDYPGTDSRAVGQVGSAPYIAGHRYGLRVSNAGNGMFLVQHLVDFVPEGPNVTLGGDDLPDGGFGFEFCCGRSFIVDDVLIERGTATERAAADESKFAEELGEQRKRLDASLAALAAERTEKPGKTAIITDVSPTPPEWRLLVRGNYGERGEPVEPGVPAVLCGPDEAYHLAKRLPDASSTGRRLALAEWLTRAGSRAAALVARVTVNRVWQAHFETGIVATPENLGYTGAPPSHPDLLEYLAAKFINDGWSMKALHRRIVLSAAYRQASRPREPALGVDPANRLLWRYPLRRLDAESVRDAMLVVSGELNRTLGGRYVPTERDGRGEVIVPPDRPGATRRSLYLQQRRTQLLTLLELFDAPSLVTNCTRRASSTIPIQSLSELNSDFAVSRGRALAKRLTREAGADVKVRIEHAFLLALGRPPSDIERAAAQQFIASQAENYPREAGAERVWADFCQMLLASNAFLYLE
jgi:hypothetical protein